MDISGDLLRAPNPSPQFRPYRDANHNDDHRNLDSDFKPHAEASSSHFLGLQYRGDGTRGVGQPTRKRSCRSFDSEGLEDAMFIDEDLVRGPVGERERILTLSPSTFGSGSSVFVFNRKHPPIFSSRLFALFPFQMPSRPAFHNFVLKFVVLVASTTFHGSRTRNVFRAWEFAYRAGRLPSIGRL